MPLRNREGARVKRSLSQETCLFKRHLLFGGRSIGETMIPIVFVFQYAFFYTVISHACIPFKRSAGIFYLEVSL